MVAGRRSLSEDLRHLADAGKRGEEEVRLWFRVTNVRRAHAARKKMAEMAHE